jgi:NosR/NirI family transcriptional regulator, nitrous oxide reductase regulator
VLVFALAALAPAALAQSRLVQFLDDLTPGELVPGADRLGAVEGEPPAAPAYRGEQRLGYVFMNTDVTDSIGYSGRPIHIAIGLDMGGEIVGAKLIHHEEPIVVIGIPEQRMTDFIAGYVGRNVLEVAAPSGRRGPAVDVVSGATVTVLVIADSITLAVRRVARSRGLGALGIPPGVPPPPAERQVDLAQTGTEDWETLLSEGSVARLHLTVGEVNVAFERLEEPAGRPEPGAPEDTFLDLYVALVSAPVIGRSLLGEADYGALQERLEPGQHAIVVGAQGPYSFLGTAWVRGGIFDRIALIQDEATVRFRDRDFSRLSSVAAEGAPRFREIGLYRLPPGVELDPASPWQLQLLVQRAVGPLERAFLAFDVTYELPEHYLEPPPVVAPAPPPATEAAPLAVADAPEEPLWLRIWRNRLLDIAIVVVALGVLTWIFFFQDWLVRRPRLYNVVRTSFLLFTLVWLGWYANAQLSVINVLTLSNALLTDFRWEFFLMDPLLFILWSAVFAALLFWGRGPFCGWLCPFGALQEFINRIAKYFRVPQITVPWALHERLWPVKYIIFLGLFAASLYSLTLSERLAEVEPFKTAIVLNFLREWPFVAYALVLLGIGVFIERFFCRYLCPLGAALAIPGRIRMFEWLKRYRECGNPCQRCGNECMVNAIHPEGHINPNECIYCLHCQTLYYDDRRCPVMIQRRLRRERASARATKDPAVILEAGGKPPAK